MSWCRWGSPCDFTLPPGLYKVDVACAENGCPGSSLYIYEGFDNAIHCCACRLQTDDSDFVAKTEDEMLDHIEAHVAAGHHVRQSLRRGASREYVEAYAWLREVQEANAREAQKP